MSVFGAGSIYVGADLFQVLVNAAGTPGGCVLRHAFLRFVGVRTDCTSWGKIFAPAGDVS